VVYGLASFLIPGLGQYLNGEPDKALVHFLVAVAIPTVGYYMAFIALNPFLAYVTPLAQLGWSIYSALDAYNVAKGYNEAHGFSLLEFDFKLGG
jgi:energy-converting hydrogenase Eha subunit E